MDEPTAWVVSVALVCTTVIYMFHTVISRLNAADNQNKSRS